MESHFAQIINIISIKIDTLKNIRVVRFIASGGIVALTNLAILITLVEFFNVWYISAEIIAFTFSFEIGFLLQKFWTFKYKSQMFVDRELAFSLIFSAINLMLNTAFLYSLVDWLGFPYVLSQIIIMGFLSFLNFSAYKFIIFKPSK